MKVLLCAIGKCENHYIREWVEHYYKLGFTRIVLYDNNDIDGERFEDVIAYYIDNKFVKLVDVRGKKEQQHPCYWNCYHKYGVEPYNYDWILFADCDEFLELDGYDNIKDFLEQEKFSKFNCIRFYWKNYTDNGLLRVENNNYSISRFKEFKPSKQGKSMIRTRLNIKLIKAHSARPLHSCDAIGNRCLNDETRSMSILGIKPMYKGAWLNHYRHKTIEEFVTNKMQRLYPDQPDDSAKKVLTLDNFFELSERTPEKENFANELLKSYQ